MKPYKKIKGYTDKVLDKKELKRLQTDIAAGRIKKSKGRKK